MFGAAGMAKAGMKGLKKKGKKASIKKPSLGIAKAKKKPSLAIAKAKKKTGKKVTGMSSGAARGTAARRKKASKAARIRGARMGYGR